MSEHITPYVKLEQTRSGGFGDITIEQDVELTETNKESKETDTFTNHNKYWDSLFTIDLESCFLSYYAPCHVRGKLSQINQTTGMNAVGLLSQIGIMNPFNRKQESEADYLGLIFSSLSGFDIRETTKIWERMKEANKGKEPPEFLSTHPSNKRRIEQIDDWMNEIILKYPPIV